MQNAETDLEEYLDKYCRKHMITPEEASKHKLIQDVKEYYESVYADKI